MPESDSIRHFRTGAINFTLKGGRLRALTCYGEEIFSLVGLALRDPNWGTIPLRVGEPTIVEHSNHRQISYTAENHLNGARVFGWSVTLILAANRLSVAVAGECLTPYRANRAGMYLRIAPATAAGQPASIHHPDGSITDTSFPTFISPHQPMQRVAGLHWNTPGGTHIELSLDGEMFEMEDERNWTDDAFKLYAPPLDQPFPVAYHRGDRIVQSLTLAIYPSQEGFRPLPRLHGCTPLYAREPAQRLAVTRRDVLPGGVVPAVFRSPVHLAFVLGGEPVAELRKLLPLVPTLGVGFVSVATVADKMLTGDTLRELFPLLQQSFPHIPRGFGSAFYFTELNRFPPPDDLDYDFVYFGNAALVHETDEWSIIETAAGQAATVCAARARYPRQEVWVSPLSLYPRFNPNRTDGGRATEEVYRPERQLHDDFIAGWVLRCLLHLAEAGCATVELSEIDPARSLFRWLRREGVTAIRRISPASQRHKTEVELRAGGSTYYILAEHVAPYCFSVVPLERKGI
ncbi:hypothetical protein [Neolewinella sp.]|uniref:hypothetical protein n=1 Tax=Neolewinella sp. TaxID=2993543 RepID=UPI003B521255